MEVEEQNSRNKRSVLLMLALILLTFIGLVVWGIILSSSSTETVELQNNAVELFEKAQTEIYTTDGEESTVANPPTADTAVLEENASLKEENMNLILDYNTLVDNYNELLEYTESLESEVEEMKSMLEDLCQIIV